MKVVHDVLFSSAFACFVHAVTSKESLSDSSCRPPTGSTYLTIGQDLLSINEYVSEQYNASLHESSFKSTTTMSDFSPAAVMAYTDIQTLRGLFRPVDYGSGIEYADGILDSLFPGQGVGLQIGLWLNGTQGCNDINQGALDENIDRLMKYLERCHASKVFLRVGYEFDNPSFGYSGDPDAFARAFRKIVHACESSKWPCRDKVKFVWHTWAAQRAQGLSLSDFYAGDDVVDWIGVSIFQQVYPWSTVEVGRLSDLEQALEFAAAHAKPTMVAESTPFGGIDMNTSQVKALSLNDPWERWYQPTLDLI